jgi:hypothetical protein
MTGAGGLIAAIFAWCCFATIVAFLIKLVLDAIARPIDKAFDQPFGDVPDVKCLQHDGSVTK